eukprot:1742300-Rhodomonas_salina.2
MSRRLPSATSSSRLHPSESPTPFFGVRVVYLLCDEEVFSHPPFVNVLSLAVPDCGSFRGLASSGTVRR